MRPENPLDSIPLVQFLDENLALVVICGFVVALLITRLLRLGNGGSGSAGGGDWGGDGGGDGGGGGE